MSDETDRVAEVRTRRRSKNTPAPAVDLAKRLGIRGMTVGCYGVDPPVFKASWWSNNQCCATGHSTVVEAARHGAARLEYEAIEAWTNPSESSWIKSEEFNPEWLGMAVS